MLRHIYLWGGWLLIAILTGKAEGVEESWAQLYQSHRSSAARGLGLWSDGSVTVAGTFSDTNRSGAAVLHYTLEGDLAWEAELEAWYLPEGSSSILAVDAGNQSYLLGNVYEAEEGLLTSVAKVNVTGEVMWSTNLTQPGWLISDHSLALDPSGNVLIFGQAESWEDSAQTIYVAKISGLGVTEWFRPLEVGREFISPLHLVGLRVDAWGNAYVVMNDTTATSHSTVMAAKIHANGDLAWTRHYQRAPGVNDNPESIAVDDHGNLFVAGTSYATQCCEPVRLFLLQYDTEGSLAWSVSTNEVSGFQENVQDMMLDAAGQVWVASRVFNQNNLERDSVITRFTSDGHLQGRSRLPDLEESRLAMDGLGGVHVTGVYRPPGGDIPPKLQTAKLGSEGVRQWLIRNEHVAEFFPGPLVAGGGADGLIHVAGTVWPEYPGGTRRILLLQYEQVEAPEAPQFLLKPGFREVLAGGSVHWEAAASGLEPLHYQWLYQGRPLTEETAASLVLENIQVEQAGGYAILVSNEVGTVVSPEALLLVHRPPSLDEFPRSQELVEGESARFEVRASGDPPFSYQWRFEGRDLAGSTNRVLWLLDAGAMQAGNYTVVVRNAYGQVESPPVMLAVRPKGVLDHWTWKLPTPQGNDLSSIIYGNHRFVTVGDAGTVMTSSDGQTWSVRHLGGPDLNAVVWGGGQYVAVGDEGSVWVSPNGIDWAPHRLAATSQFNRTLDLQEIVYGHGTYLARSLYKLLASSNGVSWTEVFASDEPYIREPVQALLYAEGRFLASFAGGLLSSQTGRQWEAEPIEPAGIRFNRLCFGPGGYVGATHDRAYLSDAASQWNQASVALIGNRGIACGELGIVGVGRDIVHSADGLSWTRIPLPAETFLRDVTWGNGRYVAVGESGTVMVSADGSAWPAITLGTDNNFRGLARGKGRFVVVGNEGIIRTSTDGRAWDEVASPATENIRAIAFGKPVACQTVSLPTTGPPKCTSKPGRFVAVGENDTGGGIILSSLDGLLWQLATIVAEELYGVGFVGDGFLAVGEGGAIYESEDGWMFRRVSTPLDRRLQGIAEGRGVYVVTGRRGAILVSSNRADWLAVPSGTSQYLESVAYGDGLFVTAGHRGVILSSTNAVDWHLEDSGMEVDFEKVVRIEGLWLVAGGDGAVLTSKDAQTWTRRSFPFNRAIRDVLYVQGAFWMAGNNETILKSSQWQPYLQALSLEDGVFRLLLRAHPREPISLHLRQDLLSPWEEFLRVTNLTEEAVYEDRDVLGSGQKFYRAVSHREP